MIGDDADNLYHWTFDVLPRLRAVDPARRAKVRVIARLRHAFHRASLEAAGFAPGSVIDAAPMTLYRTNELLAARIRKNVTAENLAHAREIYLRVAESVPAAPAPIRLYISRANATSRRVRNEAELLRVLEPRGFRSVAMEKLTFAEQLALFRDAEMVVAPTGAALANLPLCRAGTPMLVLMPLGCADYTYRDMARLAGLAPETLDVPLAPNSDPDPVKSDMVLDPACLEAVRSFIG